MPAAPATLQDSHWPEHAVSQHKPSTQLPEAHALADEHVAPFAARISQVPAWQKFPAEQFASDVHDAAQAVVPHANGAQVVVVGAGQLPVPVQLALDVATPPAQLALRQLMEAVGYEQVARRVPLQVPPHALPSEVHASRPPTGAPETATHAPTLPATLQDSHCPVHALEQHTPSTQLPDVQESALVHVAPAVSFATQAPALQ